MTHHHKLGMQLCVYVVCPEESRMFILPFTEKANRPLFSIFQCHQDGDVGEVKESGEKGCNQWRKVFKEAGGSREDQSMEDGVSL